MSNWNCEHLGTSFADQDPIVNYGPECVVCGAIQGKGSGTGKGPGTGTGTDSSKLPLIAGAVVGLVAVVGGVIFLSPSLSGICGVLGNCKSWQEDFDQAVALGDSAVAKIPDASADDLPQVKTDLEAAIELLKDIPDNAELYDEASAKQAGYQQEVDQVTQTIDDQDFEKTWRDYFNTVVAQGEAIEQKIITAEADAQEPLKQELQTVADDLAKIPDNLSFTDEVKAARDRFTWDQVWRTFLGSKVKEGDALTAKIKATTSTEERKAHEKALEDVRTDLKRIPEELSFYSEVMDADARYADTLRPPTPPTPPPVDDGGGTSSGGGGTSSGGGGTSSGGGGTSSGGGGTSSGGGGTSSGGGGTSSGGGGTSSGGGTDDPIIPTLNGPESDPTRIPGLGN